MTHIPFYDPSGKSYIKTDGIPMGPPLGPTTYQFNIFNTKNKNIWHHIIKPKIYVCHADDVFIYSKFYNVINKLKQTLEKNFVLNFTTEINVNLKNTLPRHSCWLQ